MLQGDVSRKIYSALRIQVRVILALILRETRTTFGNSTIGYLWAILTPALGVAILVWLFSLVSRQPPFGQSLALFFATGFLVFEFYNKLTNSIMNVINSNKALLLYPVVKPTSAITARFLLITLTYFIIMCLFFGALIFLGLADFPSFPINLCCAFLAISLLGLGVGLINLMLSTIWESWSIVWQIINRPMFFISGIFFIPSQLPEYALNFLKWNPVLHLIEWVRSSYYPNYFSRVLDITFLLTLSFIFIFLGLFAERLLRHRK